MAIDSSFKMLHPLILTFSLREKGLVCFPAGFQFLVCACVRASDKVADTQAQAPYSCLSTLLGFSFVGTGVSRQGNPVKVR